VPRSEGGRPPTLCPLDNRPSEHSGENHSEFADDPPRIEKLPATPNAHPCCSAQFQTDDYPATPKG